METNILAQKKCFLFPNKNSKPKSLLKSNWQFNVSQLHRLFRSSKKEKQINNKQTKKKQEKKKKQIKNGNNSTYYQPLSEEWIGKRS